MGNTLTEMLKERLEHPDIGRYLMGTIDDTKEVIRNWLKEVGLPNYTNSSIIVNKFNFTEDIRKLLVILVDEP